MVGASSGAGPILRYSSSEAPMRKNPLGAVAVTSSTPFAAAGVA
jgi:hypothetical protein